MKILWISAVFILIHFKGYCQIYIHPIIGLESDLIDERDDLNDGTYGSFDVNTKLFENSSMTLGIGGLFNLNKKTYLSGTYYVSMAKRVNALMPGFVPRHDISFMKQSLTITFQFLINEYISFGSGFSLIELNNIKTFYYSGGSEKFHSNINQIGIPLQISLLYERYELRFNYIIGVLSLYENPFKPIQSIGLSLIYRFRINLKSNNVNCPK